MAESLLITFSVCHRSGACVAVEGLQLPVDGAGVTVLFGASGSGKTTVLRVMAGLLRPDTGVIRMGGETWLDSGAGVCRPTHERSIGFVPQDHALFPHLSVARNVAYGLEKLTGAEQHRRVEETLGWLGIGDLANRRPDEISGGQQQRVALARAVARRPKLLLLDEPLAALDAPTRRHLRGELHSLLVRTGIPSIVVTHEPAEALALADTLVLMHGGKILQSGLPHDVFNRPTSLEAAGILGVDAVVGGIVESCDGQVVGVRAAGLQLLAFSPEPLSPGTFVSVCIRAEDVMLARREAPACSARNRLAGSVVSVTGEGGLVRVGMECGFPLQAVLTRQSAEELDLHPGSPIEARIKVPNMHLIPRLEKG